MTKKKGELHYSPAEVAEVLEVAEVTVRRWIKAKKIRAIRNKLNKRIYIPESEIERLQEDRWEEV